MWALGGTHQLHNSGMNNIGWRKVNDTDNMSSQCVDDLDVDDIEPEDMWAVNTSVLWRHLKTEHMVVKYDNKLYFEEGLLRKLDDDVRKYKADAERQAWGVACLLFVLCMAAWWKQM